MGKRSLLNNKSASISVAAIVGVVIVATSLRQVFSGQSNPAPIKIVDSATASPPHSNISIVGVGLVLDGLNLYDFNKEILYTPSQNTLHPPPATSQPSFMNQVINRLNPSTPRIILMDHDHLAELYAQAPPPSPQIDQYPFQTFSQLSYDKLAAFYIKKLEARSDLPEDIKEKHLSALRQFLEKYKQKLAPSTF